MKKLIACIIVYAAIFTIGCKKNDFDVTKNKAQNNEVATGLDSKKNHALLDKSVRVIYLIPHDVLLNRTYYNAIKKAAPVLQKWYRDQMNGITYRLNNPAVEQLYSDKTTTWFNADNGANISGSDPQYYFWYNTINEVSRLLGSEWNTSKYTFTIYIDADGTGTGGVTGYCVMPKNDLKGLSGQMPEPVSRWIGGWGHELGHAFGLPHPDGSPYWDQAIMGTGYIIFPKCILLESDRTTLLGNGFFFPWK